jgi:hypothetical protein
MVSITCENNKWYFLRNLKWLEWTKKMEGEKKAYNHIKSNAVWYWGKCTSYLWKDLPSKKRMNTENKFITACGLGWE